MRHKLPVTYEECLRSSVAFVYGFLGGDILVHGELYPGGIHNDVLEEMETNLDMADRYDRVGLFSFIPN